MQDQVSHKNHARDLYRRLLLFYESRATQFMPFQCRILIEFGVVYYTKVHRVHGNGQVPMSSAHHKWILWDQE